MYLLRVHYKKKRSEKDLFDIDYAIFLIFFINAYVVGTHLHCALRFFKITLRFFKITWNTYVKTCMDLLRVHYKKDQKRTFDDDYAIFFPEFLHEGIYCGYSFELHQLVNAIQMSTHTKDMSL